MTMDKVKIKLSILIIIVLCGCSPPEHKPDLSEQIKQETSNAFNAGAVCGAIATMERQVKGLPPLTEAQTIARANEILNEESNKK